MFWKVTRLSCVDSLVCSWVCACTVQWHEGSWDIPGGSATSPFYYFSYFKTLILSLEIHEMTNSGQTASPRCLLLKYLQFTAAADRSIYFICYIQEVLFMFQNLRFQTISVLLKVNIGLNPTCFWSWECLWNSLLISLTLFSPSLGYISSATLANHSWLWRGSKMCLSY